MYDFVIVRNGQRLITGSADSELRVWDIEYIESGVSHDEGHVELSILIDVEVKK